MPRLILLAAFALTFLPMMVFAQERRPSHCIAIADAAPGISYIQKAAWREPVPEFSVRISYINHASFLIQSPGGLNVVTDFTGFLGGADLVPDVVTMNHAHETHWTANPDERISHVLPGWGEFGKGIEHHLDLGEMLVRNVSTDIRSRWGGTEDLGNSIFVFEVAGLCVGHLGHLHHVPNDEQFAALGRLDVVMAAVDGGTTMPLPDVIKVVQRLKSSIVIPMHWFSTYTLDAFLLGIAEDFQVERTGKSWLEVSLRTLPSQPSVMVLQPRYLLEE